jgi:dipeptidyl aminopeptidase/acylaminoacyl peptidase
VWATATGKDLLRIGGPKRRFVSLAFSPSGGTLAVAESRRGGPENYADSLHLWEVASGQEIRQIDDQQGGVGVLAFAPDGRSLATGGMDSTILLWDLTGQATQGKLNSAPPPSPAELDRQWADLAGDASKADKAIWVLVLAQKQSVPFLQKRMKAGEAAADQEKKSLEVIRELRAIEVLEHIATPEARQVLEFLAKAAPNPGVAEAAGAALQRLAKQRSSMP